MHEFAHFFPFVALGKSNYTEGADLGGFKMGLFEGQWL